MVEGKEKGDTGRRARTTAHRAQAAAAAAAAASTATGTPAAAEPRTRQPGAGGGGGGEDGGTDCDTAPENRADLLVNLEVKVLTQPLGAENQWVERGDGVVEFADFTIRVVADRRRRCDVDEQGNAEIEGGSAAGSPPAAAKAEGKGTSPAIASLEAANATTAAGGGTPTVIMEDTIDTDTPFVGENCCIVWNSFDQQISLCLMCSSEEGYAACWSALLALQEKEYPPLGIDLLRRCRAAGEGPAGGEGLATTPQNGAQAATKSEDTAGGASPCDDKAAGQEAAALSPAAAEEVPLPYAYYIHSCYDPPLGFIEQHALSLTIIEFDHLSNPDLYTHRGVLRTLLNVANADLLESLLCDGPFQRLLTGLNLPPLSSRVGSVPEALHRLNLPEALAALISKDARINYIQEQLARTANLSANLDARLTSLCHRFRNELACKLLESHDILTQAREALLDCASVTCSTAAFPLPANSQLAASELTTSTVSATVTGEERRGSTLATTSSSLPGVEGQGATAEQQVLAHLRFFRTLVTLAVTELGKELVAPIVAKVFEGGLLEVLSLVAENFAVPQGLGMVFLAGLASSNCRMTPHRSSYSGPNNYAASVEQELALFFDVTLVRLNERWEEQLMNELVRTPVMTEPTKYNGLMTFLLCQLILANSTSCTATHRPVVMVRDSVERRNPYLLFHLLGLHEEEAGTADQQQQQTQQPSSQQQQRVPDAECLEVRHRFQHFVITKYLVHAMCGVMTRVPLPPSGVNTAGGGVKSAPIVQFSNIGLAATTSSLNSGLTNLLTTSSPANAGGGQGRISSSGSSTLSRLPQGISSALIHLLDALLRSTSVDNRDAILRALCNHKSCILHYIEMCCDLACQRKFNRIGLDVLSGNVRFLRTVLAQMVERSTSMNETVLIMFAVPVDQLPKSAVTMVCRQLTVECDVFGAVLRTYRALGGVRRHTVFHSAVLSMLDLIDKMQPTHGEYEDANTNNMYDVRNFIFLKHLDLLPDRFLRRFRESLLAETCMRLGREDLFSASVSVLSSTVGSEMLRSSSKLRFVDEVEAVTGGVDGTVVPSSIATLNPAVVASVHNTEDKFARQQRRKAAVAAAAAASGQWSTAGSSPLTGVSGILSSKSPPRPAVLLPVVPNTAAGVDGVAGPVAAGSATALLRAVGARGSATSPPLLANEDGEGMVSSGSGGGGSNSSSKASLGVTLPRPTAPKNEKPANRPRHVSGVDAVSSPLSAGSGATTSSPSSSSAGGRRTTPTLATSATASASTADGAGNSPSPASHPVVLPKIRKRHSSVKR